MPIYGPPTLLSELIKVIKLLEQHSAVVAGTGGGKSTVFVNLLLLRKAYRLDEKFLRVLLFADTCSMSGLPHFATLEEYYTFFKTVFFPSGKKFNSYWVLL